MANPVTIRTDTFDVWRQNTNTIGANVGDPASLYGAFASTVLAINDLNTIKFDKAGGTVTGSVTITGNGNVQGNTTLGTNSANSLTVNAKVATDLRFQTGLGIKTDQTNGNTLLIQGYNTTGATYTSFLTITTQTTATADLNSAVTQGGTTIYRATGLDVALADGGTNASLVASHGAIVYSTASALGLSAVGSTGQILRSAAAGAPTWSTATYPSTATGTGTIMRADGTNWVATTATFPTTATAGKILRASGTNVWANSTASYPDTATNAGRIMRADGTNWVETTATYPATGGGAGTILRSDGTNWVNSTTTWPNTTTSKQILVSTSANVVGELTIGTAAQLVGVDNTPANGYRHWTIAAGTGINVDSSVNGTITVASTGVAPASYDVTAGLRVGVNARFGAWNGTTLTSIPGSGSTGAAIEIRPAHTTYPGGGSWATTFLISGFSDNAGTTNTITVGNDGELKIGGTLPGTPNFRVQATGAVTALGDYVLGANRVTMAASSGNTLIAGTLGVSGTSTFGNVSVTGSGSIVTLSPTGAGTVNINPATAGSIDNVAIGTTTRSSGRFTTLDANNAVTFTQNTGSTSTTTGTLVVTGGVGISQNVFIGGTINVTGIGTFTATPTFNSGALASTQAAISLFTSTATSVTIGGASCDTTIGRNLTANSNLTVGTAVGATATIGVDTVVQTATVTLSAAALATVCQFAAATYRSCHFLIQAVDATGTKYHRTTIDAIHDGTNAEYAEYGALWMTNGNCGDFVVDLSGGNVRLRVTPSSANSTVFKVTMILTKV
jgi:hypothetical protein